MCFSDVFQKTFFSIAKTRWSAFNLKSSWIIISIKFCMCLIFCWACLFWFNICDVIILMLYVQEKLIMELVEGKRAAGVVNASWKISLMNFHRMNFIWIYIYNKTFGWCGCELTQSNFDLILFVFQLVCLLIF